MTYTVQRTIAHWDVTEQIAEQEAWDAVLSAKMMHERLDALAAFTQTMKEIRSLLDIAEAQFDMFDGTSLYGQRGVDEAHRAVMSVRDHAQMLKDQYAWHALEPKRKLT